jgi:AcrR family transcriptional regulator
MNTKQRILNAAIELLSRDASALIEAIAEAASVSRMTLHRYFSSRKALIEAASMEALVYAGRMIDAAIEAHPDPLDQLEAIVKGAAMMGGRFNFVVLDQEIFEREPLKPHVDALETKVGVILDALRADGRLKPGFANPWLICLIDGLLTTAFNVHRQGTVAPKEIPDLVWRSLTGGVFAPGSQPAGGTTQ